MEHLQTPIRNKNISNRIVMLPPSPSLKQLGHGTGITVYKMERIPQTDNKASPWAIKKVASSIASKKTEYQQRLKYEAEILRKLDHPNIVGYRGLVKSFDGTDCLAMEECSKCLGAMIDERFETINIPFPAENILKVAFDISKALLYLHETVLILHGDIKSYNILIKGDFATCKLCDFGVSMPIDSSGNLDYTKTDPEAEYIGTTSWCPPEIFQCPSKITTKADIYAYGLVLWEMMALSPPFFNDNSASDLDTTQSSDSLSNFERPQLPPNDFDDSYTLVIELFYCCTELDYLKRPSAKDLILTIKNAKAI
ncbi:lymphokine-activated killer T-cell-originated protein kinase [Agrilus planipennis]|uniref:Lymphokine-activated killer T-cell-originated protein kinase n=1 Tax=Agrilus planipennis TaxID=224129 RepID=A0A1W4XVF0_AGRPL|nr:lymphokine-activated killer T-cell-originated protein kinase [Agrilus planipennis]